MFLAFQKLIIQHPDYGVLRDYFYPINIEGGKTYEMLIDIGTGRYATITSGVAKATIFVDGDDCGVSPVRKYLNYGRHTIKAVRDRFEGETTAVITISQDQSANPRQLIHVEMQDMSHLFGDVVVKVDNRADIFLNGQNMGTGEWRTQLREGNYTIETRKANSEPAMTSFVVKARQMNESSPNPKKAAANDALAPLSRQLSKFLGAPVKMKSNAKGAGSISISFKDEDDLTRLMQLFDKLKK